MIEPFKAISNDTKVFDQKGEEVIKFNASRFVSCYYSYYRDLFDPIIITEKLSNIFDDGNEVHFDEEWLNMGARRILSIENNRISLKIKDIKERFIITGRHDYLEFDFKGKYIRDVKSGELGGFYFFLRDGINDDYKKQLSIYAYLIYISTGVWINKGVITKIDKKNPRNRISLETNLFSLSETREIILNHPIIKYHLKEITLNNLIDLCLIQMCDSEYKCENCQYTESCPVIIKLIEIKKKGTTKT